MLESANGWRGFRHKNETLSLGTKNWEISKGKSQGLVYFTSTLQNQIKAYKVTEGKEEPNIYWAICRWYCEIAGYVF